MELFLATLSQMGFLFLFVAIGFILVKVKFLPSNASGILAKLENSIFIPALVLSTFIKDFTVQNLSSDWIILVASVGLSIVVIPVSFLVSVLCTKNGFLRKTFTYGLSFSNFGFMGNAVVQALFPEIFFEYLIFTFPFWIIIYAWGVPALLMNGDGKKGFKATLKRFCNPTLISALVGIILGLTRCPMPQFITDALKSAGDCMSPIAMILTGIVIAGMNVKKVLSSSAVYVITAVKLLVFPLIFVGVIALFPALNFSTTAMICITCLLAMPLGMNIIVIPSAYGKDVSVGAGLIMVSCLLSVITIPIVFYLLSFII